MTTTAPSFSLTIRKGERLIPARVMTDHVRWAELPVLKCELAAPGTTATGEVAQQDEHHEQR